MTRQPTAREDDFKRKFRKEQKKEMKGSRRARQGPTAVWSNQRSCNYNLSSQATVPEYQDAGETARLLCIFQSGCGLNLCFFCKNTPINPCQCVANTHHKKNTLQSLNTKLCFLMNFLCNKLIFSRSTQYSQIKASSSKYVDVGNTEIKAWRQFKTWDWRKNRIDCRQFV